MNRKFRGVIWTDHVLERLRERDIKQSDAWYAFRKPDESKFAKSKGGWVYSKLVDGRRIEVVAKKEDDEWVIISAWADPVDPSARKLDSTQGVFDRIKKFISGL